MNGIKVKLVVDDRYGFKKGEVYDAIIPKSRLKNFDLICVINKQNEEYAYPRDWFEVVY